jgi:hypothetical protein
VDQFPSGEVAQFPAGAITAFGDNLGGGCNESCRTGDVRIGKRVPTRGGDLLYFVALAGDQDDVTWSRLGDRLRNRGGATKLDRHARMIAQPFANGARDFGRVLIAGIIARQDDSVSGSGGDTHRRALLWVAIPSRAEDQDHFTRGANRLGKPLLILYAVLAMIGVAVVATSLLVMRFG